MLDVRVAALLRDVIGLDPESIGVSTIARAAADRMAASATPDADAYWARLAASADEQRALVEAVVVAETWFFRDPEAFAALGAMARDRAHRGAPDASIRLLSLPCSTGEEPYAMAMALMDAGLPPDRFQIDGVDVSERALARARAGVYGKASFRSGDLRFRDRYFDALDDGTHRIGAAPRTSVTFHASNICDTNLLSAAAPYDFVWCRNLLIYLDRTAQDLAMTTVQRLLAPGGVLFVGSSESGVATRHGFRSTKVPMAFAFHRGEPVESAPARLDRTPPVRARKRPSTRPTADTALKAVMTPTVVVPVRTRADVSRLEQAQELADAGRFDEAARACQEHLTQHGASADAFYLLGLVSDAQGRDADAERYYRKVLYLKPNHADALLHLAFLMDKHGQDQHASVLRQRMKRLGANPEA